MIFKVGVMGATGKMGLEVCALLAQGWTRGSDSLELAAAVAGSSKLKSVEGVEVRTLAEPLREPVHVWVDFSRPSGTLALLEVANAPVVIATTGLEETEKAAIEEFSRTYGVVLAPNTSPGMNLFFDLISSLASGQGWAEGVYLIDEHHSAKKDAPSGTAKKILELCEEAGMRTPEVKVTRAGGIRGNHTLRFIGPFEELEVSHRVYDRRTFAEGALRAAHFLAKIGRPGLYPMSRVFEGQS